MPAPAYESVSIDEPWDRRKTATHRVSYQRSIETISDKSTRRRQKHTLNWKPVFLRPLALTLLFVLTLILIGVLEWAVLHFPHRSVLREVRIASNNVKREGLFKRSGFELGEANYNDADIAPVLPGCATGANAGFALITQRAPSASASEPPTAPSSSPGAAPSASSTKPSAFVQSESAPAGSTVTSTASRKAFVLSTSSSSSSPGGTSSAPRNAFVLSSSSSSTTPSPITKSAKANAFVHSSSSSSNSAGQSKPPSASSSAFIRSTSASSAFVRSTSSSLDSSRSIGGVESPSNFVQSHSASTKSPSTHHSPSPSTTTKNNGGHGGNARHSRSAAASASGSAAAKAIHGHGGGADGESGEQDKQHTPLGGAGTFASSYLPTIVAVFYRMLWTVLSNSFNLVEPCRLLARPEGASASAALFSAYQSKPTLPGCFKEKKWALAIVTLASSLADLLPALASQSVYINTGWDSCPNPNPRRPQNPCPRQVEVFTAVIRSMQAFLAFACVVLVWLLAFLWWTSTGLSRDPSSIGAVASLMSNDTLRHDLNQVSGNADTKEARRLLSRSQYRLSHFETGSGEVRYGIQTGLYSDDSGIWPLSHSYAPVEQRKDSSHKQRHDKNDWLLDLLLIFVVLGLFGVVFAYHKVGGHSGFNDFFNSGNFGPAFIVTLAATVIATLWKRTEISMTVMAPYQRLAKKPSSAESTVLFEATSTPLISTIQAFHHRYFMLATITIVTLLADLALNVVIGGVPYARGESLRQSRVSAWLSMSILIIMFFTSVVLMVSRFRSSRIPRRPDTLGIVMTYLAGGHLPYAFEVTEYVSDDEWDSAVRSQGKMYQLQEMRRENGTYAWTIDEVENRPKYYE